MTATPMRAATLPLCAQAIFDRELRASELRSLARLMGLAWDGTALQPLRLELAEVQVYLCAGGSTVCRHLRHLQAAGYLTWRSTRDRYYIEFPPLEA